MMIKTGELALFRDRHDAGQRLARKLLHYKEVENTIVIALPRGGVVVGDGRSGDCSRGAGWSCVWLVRQWRHRLGETCAQSTRL